MVMEESLGLSLSLGGGGGIVDPKPHWSQLLVGSLAERPSSLPEVTRPLLGGIDVNRPPTAERELEDETGLSSPNSTVSSVSGKRGNRDESETERAFSDDEDGSRKKLRLSKDQSAVLEESFKEHNTLNPKQKQALAKQLNLRPRQVEVWFQNRRARTKLKQTEVDCEFLKRCCENLTEENRRLQKEVQELRALKLSPQFYMQMTPPTTLTMCPSCERVAVSASNANANANFSDAQDNSKDGRSGIAAQYPQQHNQLFQHRPALPWAPQPLRTAKFLDASTPRS